MDRSGQQIPVYRNNSLISPADYHPVNNEIKKVISKPMKKDQKNLKPLTQPGALMQSSKQAKTSIDDAILKAA